MRSSRSLD